MIRKGAVGSYSEYIVAHTDLKRNKIFILLRWRDTSLVPILLAIVDINCLDGLPPEVLQLLCYKYS